MEWIERKRKRENKKGREERKGQEREKILYSLRDTHTYICVYMIYITAISNSS